MHYLIRIGDGNNFRQANKFNAFALNTNANSARFFINNVKPKDVLWFIESGSRGKLCYV